MVLDFEVLLGACVRIDVWEAFLLDCFSLKNSDNCQGK